MSIQTGYTAPPAAAPPAAPPTMVLDLSEADNPYPGLRPFDEGSAPAGHEREALVQQLIDAGMVEEFEVSDTDGRVVTAIRRRDANGNIALPG